MPPPLLLRLATHHMPTAGRKQSIMPQFQLQTGLKRCAAQLFYGCLWLWNKRDSDMHSLATGKREWIRKPWTSWIRGIKKGLWFDFLVAEQKGNRKELPEFFISIPIFSMATVWTASGVFKRLEMLRKGPPFVWRNVGKQSIEPRPIFGPLNCRRYTDGERGGSLERIECFFASFPHAVG